MEDPGSSSHGSLISCLVSMGHDGSVHKVNSLDEKERAGERKDKQTSQTEAVSLF